MRCEDNSRLEIYTKIKEAFGFEEYLKTSYEIRKNIAKIRCSTHSLEIQQGRHKRKPRNERLCKVCNCEKVETEEHFFLSCPLYEELRRNYNLAGFTNIKALFKDTPVTQFGLFLKIAFEFRKNILALLESQRNLT